MSKDTSPSAFRGHETRGMAIVRELRRRGRLRRSALGAALATSSTTLGHTIDLLLQSGSVLGDGRSHLRLNPDIGILVGVNVTRSTATVAISDLGYRLINDPTGHSAQMPLPMNSPPSAILAIANLVSNELKAHLSPDVIDRRLVGVGVSFPAPVLRERGPDTSLGRAAAWDRRVRAGPILPGWDELDVAAELALALKTRHDLRPPRHEHKRRFVWLENGSSAGALGVHTDLLERFAEDAPADLIYVRMSDGIGAGIISKGHLLTGARGYAGELGHIVVAPGGALCGGCGGRGCLETVASTQVLHAQLRPAYLAAKRFADASGPEGKPEPSPLDFLNSGHPAVHRGLYDAGWHVGAALAGICCFLNPSWIVFAGQVAEQRLHRQSLHGQSFSESSTADGARPFIHGARQALSANTTSRALEQLELRTWSDVRSDNHRQLSPELLGALALALDHLGDAYLLPPIGEWLRSSRSGTVSFG